MFARLATEMRFPAFEAPRRIRAAIVNDPIGTVRPSIPFDAFDTFFDPSHVAVAFLDGRQDQSGFGLAIFVAQTEPRRSGPEMFTPRFMVGNQRFGPGSPMSAAAGRDRFERIRT